MSERILLDPTIKSFEAQEFENKLFSKVVGQDRAVFRRQIADIAIRGQDPVARSEVLIDSLCLSRRFDNDDVH